MCVDEENLGDFIAELKNVIRVFTEDINVVLNESLEVMRVNPREVNVLKHLVDNIHGVSKV